MANSARGVFGGIPQGTLISGSFFWAQERDAGVGIEALSGRWLQRYEPLAVLLAQLCRYKDFNVIDLACGFVVKCNCARLEGS